MSLGHFSYLLSEGRPRHTKVASERLEHFAKIAAKRFLEERAPLNATIEKIASENDLNPSQVERVCEMANIATHRALWAKTAQKESVAFPLADAKQVVTVIKKKPLDADDPGSPMVSGSCGTVTSPVDSDYAGPPKGIPGNGAPLATMMGVDPSAGHQGLHEDGDRKKVIIILQKKAAQRSALRSELLYKGHQVETLEKQAYSEFKQAVLGGQSFYDLFAGAALAGFGKVAREHFPDWQDRVISEVTGKDRLALEKQAIHRAPDDLISDNLGNVTVINGAHPVLISLDTLTRKTGEVKNLLNNILRIDDEVKIYSQRMRELS